ncbi:hypothetical protein CBR_g4329 [Chara braunii]|uniref:F-box domain-containing protein n=1 Tax=Chara braunii TaxID=69332 RepID=A0A388JRF1_CHABU|nr:hypothetical protein CBR_g4329 [Chara braunii]|eukprot:GBG60371.1 hypothetical protein CBR_g4329 [Chara braunii]
MQTMETNMGGPHDNYVGKIMSLAPDHLLIILQLLPAPSVLSFSMTCRHFQALAENDAVWYRLCKLDWGAEAVDGDDGSGLALLRRRRQGWMHVYREVATLRSATWRRVSLGDVLPRSRASSIICLVSKRLILFGGGSSGGRHLDDTWIMDAGQLLLTPTLHHGQGSNLWSRICEDRSPPGRFGHMGTAMGKMLLLFGGFNDTGMRLSDTWICELRSSSAGVGVEGEGNSAEESWSWRQVDVRAAPPARGAHAGSFVPGGKVVIFGGINDTGVRLCDTWLLDLEHNPPCWQEIRTVVRPPSRSGHTLSWVGGGQLVLFGGRSARFEVLNDLWLLDLEELPGPVWRELWPVRGRGERGGGGGDEDIEWPSPRAGHSATPVLGGRLVVIGGEDKNMRRKSDTWILDPRAWGESGYGGGGREGKEKDNKASAAGVVGNNDKLPPRCSTASSCMRGAGGGSNAGGGGRGGRFSGRKLWRRLKIRGDVPRRRSFHSACALEGGCSIVVFGGMVDGELSPQATRGLEFNGDMFVLQLVPKLQIDKMPSTIALENASEEIDFSLGTRDKLELHRED